MNRFTNYLKGIGLVICVSLFTSSLYANTFTAVASGNFSAGATWGGTAPSSTLSTDVVIIPNGITVTLDNNVSFSSSSSLVVNGTLTSGSYMTGLIISGALGLSGNGSINVDSMALGLSSGLTYTGSVTARNFTSMGATVATAASVTVTGTLRLASGLLSFTSGSLSLSGGSTIELSGGTVSASGSGSLSLTSTYDVRYTTASATAGAELSGSGLRNITINVPSSSSVTLSADLSTGGSITLTSGMLVLNNHNLTITGSGDVSASGSGTISSSSGSNISITSANGLTGSLTFTGGANTVNNFTINTTSSSGSVSLGSDMNVNGQLNLQSGDIKLGNNNLMLSSTAGITGGSSTSYVMTNGGGMLSLYVSPTASGNFQIGTTTNYSPITVAGSGSASGNVSASAMNGVYLNGTSGTSLSATQPMVNTTWIVNSSMGAGASYSISPMWSGSMEVNGFNRTQAYVSSYSGGTWDAQTSSSASTSGGLYTMNRSGIIETAGTYAVVDQNAKLTAVPYVANNNAAVNVYPNPATDRLYFNSNVKIDHVTIYDITGHLLRSEAVNNISSVSVSGLPAGNYNIYFSGKEGNAVQKFVKE